MASYFAFGQAGQYHGAKFIKTEALRSKLKGLLWETF